MKYDLGAELYKFTSSRFKSYFVLSTNCCLLADSIVGQAGTAVLDVRGVIAPGTYQDYLEYELKLQTGGSIHEQYIKKRKTDSKF